MTIMHSGKLGDLIYACCGFKMLADRGEKVDLVLGDGPLVTRGTMATMVTLMQQQPYINSVRVESDPLVNSDWIDMAGFRAEGREGENLVIRQARFLGQFPVAMIREAMLRESGWLTVDAPVFGFGGTVIVNRTSNYQNWNMPWPRLVKEWRERGLDVRFLGSQVEWSVFEAEYGLGLPWVQLGGDLLDVARAIAGCKIFAGNQSCCYAIAEALKKECVLEVCARQPDCMFRRPGVTHF